MDGSGRTGSDLHLICMLTLYVLAVILMLRCLMIVCSLNIILFNFHKSSADGVGDDGQEKGACFCPRGNPGPERSDWAQAPQLERRDSNPEPCLTPSPRPSPTLPLFPAVTIPASVACGLQGDGVCRGLVDQLGEPGARSLDRGSRAGG